MKQTAVEWLEEQLIGSLGIVLNEHQSRLFNEVFITQAKEMEEKKLLEMLHKFGFDYIYNYKGEKTIYEWISEWFEEYKRIEEKHKNK